MGIRFTCANGHKLNVKSNLAGHRGWCPHCGVSVEIPLESTRESRREKRNREEAGQGVTTGGVPTPPEAEVFSNVVGEGGAKNAAAWGAAPSSSATVSNPVTTTANSEPVPPFRPGVPPPAPQDAVASSAMAAAMTVLAEKPSAVWYLHQGDSQRGPYLVDSIQGFLQESRIDADTMFWREDWPDWREAPDVFPTLFPNESSSSAATTSPGPLVAAAGTVSSPASRSASGVKIGDLLGGTGNPQLATGTPRRAGGGGTESGAKLPIPINGITALGIFVASLLLLGIGACQLLTRHPPESTGESSPAVAPEVPDMPDITPPPSSPASEPDKEFS